MKKWQNLREARAIGISISDIVRNPIFPTTSYECLLSFTWAQQHVRNLELHVLIDVTTLTGSLRISDHDRQLAEQVVLLTGYFPRPGYQKTPRWLFRCPETGRRVATIYLLAHGHLFASAAAWSIRVYAAENARKLDRLHHRLRGLYEQLGAPYPGSVSPPPPRPPGMFQTTYLGICNQILATQWAIWTVPTQEERKLRRSCTARLARERKFKADAIVRKS